MKRKIFSNFFFLWLNKQKKNIRKNKFVMKENDGKNIIESEIKDIDDIRW